MQGGVNPPFLNLGVIFHIDYKKVPNKILNEKTRKN